MWGGQRDVEAEHLFDGDTKRAGELACFLLMTLKLGGLAALEFCLKPEVEVEEFVEVVCGQLVRFRGLRVLLLCRDLPVFVPTCLSPVVVVRVSFIFSLWKCASDM